MDCLVSLMRSVLLIALMLDCGGRRESEKESEGEGRRWGESKRRRESAEGMCPQGACLGLGQGFRNAPLEIQVKARAGLEECYSRELREEAGWGRARGMFPQSTPLTLEQKWRGSTGGESALPRPPSGSRMAADQVSVWGSASCRQGFRLPWGGDRRLEALLFHRPFQKHFTNALSHCLTALSTQPCIVTDPS